MEQGIETEIGSIHAPGIQKKNHGAGDRVNIDKIKGRLVVINNAIQTNFSNLDMLNYDLTVVERFKEFLDERFSKYTELVNAKKAILEETQRSSTEDANSSISLTNLHQIYLENNKTIQNIERNLKMLGDDKQKLKEEAYYLKDTIKQYIIEEDSIKKSIDNIRAQETIALLEQNAELKKKSEKNIKQMQEKINTIDAPKKKFKIPQEKIIIQKENTIVMILLGLLIILLLIKYFF